MSLPSEITRDDLLEHLAKVGYPVTRHQLHRWCYHAILQSPRLVTRGPQGGRGTHSVYVESAVREALTIAWLHDRGIRKDDDVAWHLWLFGFPLTGYVRDLLMEEVAFQRKAVELLLGLTPQKAARYRRAFAQQLRKDRGMQADLDLAALWDSCLERAARDLGRRSKKSPLHEATPRVVAAFLNDLGDRVDEGWKSGVGAQIGAVLQKTESKDVGEAEVKAWETLSTLQRRLRRMSRRNLERLRDEAQAVVAWQDSFGGAREWSPIGRGLFIVLLRTVARSETEKTWSELVGALIRPSPLSALIRREIDKLLGDIKR